MKKRIFVCCFIFTVSVFHLSIPNIVFGQSLKGLGLDNYDRMFRNPEVNEFFPDFLRALQEPTNHFYVTDPNFVKSFVNDPRQIWAFYPEADQSLVVLLTVDDQFRKLFNDAAFHAVLKNTKKIGDLAELIDRLEPHPPDLTCPLPTESEPSRATTLSKVPGKNQSGEIGKQLAQPFVVGVLDQDGKPLQGIWVTFTVTAGNGRLSVTRQSTDVYGQARTTLTLGSQAGLHSVTARAASITQTQMFTATAIAPPEPGPGPVVSMRSPTEEPPLYWIEGNTIYHRPTDGVKTMFPVSVDGTLTGGLAVDTIGGKVYWTERTINNMGRIQSADLDGTNPQEVKEIRAIPSNITVGTDTNDKRWVYWTISEISNKKIQRINVDGSSFDGDFMEFPSAPTPPNHIAFDQGEFRLYWTETDRIRWVAADGKGKRDTIVEDLGELGGIAVADGTVYWTEQTNGLGKVRSMNGNGSADKKLLATTESIPVGIGVDTVGKRVYWTTTDGEIQSAPLTGAIQTVDTNKVGGAESSADAIALGGTAGVSASPAAPSLSPVVSVENTLLANYPNPFNPETWIPYQLSVSADVSVSIYSVNGHLVRRLDLGHQSAGMYRSRSRAAYWDGRNEFGERVASGLYFYTLTAGDFTATRKMLIRK